MQVIVCYTAEIKRKKPQIPITSDPVIRTKSFCTLNKSKIRMFPVLREMRFVICDAGCQLNKRTVTQIKTEKGCSKWNCFFCTIIPFID